MPSDRRFSCIAWVQKCSKRVFKCGQCVGVWSIGENVFCAFQRSLSLRNPLKIQSRARAAFPWYGMGYPLRKMRKTLVVVIRTFDGADESPMPQSESCWLTINSLVSKPDLKNRRSSMSGIFAMRNENRTNSRRKGFQQIRRRPELVSFSLRALAHSFRCIQFFYVCDSLSDLLVELSSE